MRHAVLDPTPPTSIVPRTMNHVRAFTRPLRIALMVAFALAISNMAQARAEGRPLALPTLTAVAKPGSRLNVVATTDIIGDVLSRVGGTLIELTVLMAAGQDPHGFKPTPRELGRATKADVLFVNGWRLEESLIDTLSSAAAAVPQVPISAGIVPRGAGASDPHVWMSVPSVIQWTQNAAEILGSLDPANDAAYAANAARYVEELVALDEELKAQFKTLPDSARTLVTNHDALGYFAKRYGFRIVGTVMSGASTLTEPSAHDLGKLVKLMRDNKICTIFSESTARTNVASAVAAELKSCPHVSVVQLNTGTLGDSSDGVPSYSAMMRANAAAILRAAGGT